MKYPNLKEEKRLWRQGYNFIIGLDEAGRGCERADAEVLTNNGWKFYYDINLEDKVLSYTNDGYLEWQEIKKIIKKNFEGNLIELKNRGIHIVVTPDHYFNIIRRVFKRDKKDNNKLKLIGYKTRERRKMVTELVDNDFMPRGGRWKGINKEFFKLPKLDKNKEKFINIKSWIAFLGIFLSEGSVSYYKKKGSYKIVISQNQKSSPKKYKKIYDLIKKLSFKFNRFDSGFSCCNKQLYTYLKQFGKRYDKFIPRHIKELPPHLLNILINWMILGDGACYTNKDRKEVCVFYTTSKRLRDDFEEILLKAGWTYHTTIRVPRDRYIGRRLIKKENQVPCFEIRLRRNNKAIVKHLHKKSLFYKGKVFCLQLSRHHNFYVRRNGTGYFTGNSLSGPVIACAVCLKIRRGRASTDFKKIKDSKQLSSKKREEVYELLKDNPNIEWGIGRVGEKVIDRINILEATKIAMQRAVRNLEKKIGREIDFLIIDGNFAISCPTCQKSIIKADEKVFSCAAAGIIAKLTRDRMMFRYHKKYPQYSFDRHKGYPTKLHRDAIKKYGFCSLHRKTFRVS